MRLSKIYRCLFFFLIAPAVIVSTAGAADKLPPAKLLLENHPLANKIWSVRDEQFIDIPLLSKQARNSDYVLLGETHDNALHHLRQAEVLAALGAQERAINVVMEMLTDSQANKLGGRNIAGPDAFFDIVDWDTSGWPPRNDYEPILAVILRSKFPLYAGNIDRKTLRSYISSGQAALPAEIRDYINETPLSTSALDGMHKEIIASHCGMLPEDMAAGMILGQRTRDAIMARALIDNRGDSTGVLIAGSGHTRDDHGVPVYLARHDPDARIVTVAWIEVKEDIDDPREYAAAWNRETMPFDHVWFTPRVDRTDPCDQLKARHKQR